MNFYIIIPWSGSWNTPIGSIRNPSHFDVLCLFQPAETSSLWGDCCGVELLLPVDWRSKRSLSPTGICVDSKKICDFTKGGLFNYRNRFFGWFFASRTSRACCISTSLFCCPWPNHLAENKRCFLGTEYSIQRYWLLDRALILSRLNRKNDTFSELLGTKRLHFDTLLGDYVEKNIARMLSRWQNLNPTCFLLNYLFSPHFSLRVTIL